MRYGALIIAVPASVAMLAAPASTTSAASSHHRSHSHRQASVPTAQPQARIACTPAGCQPIPSGCVPVPGRTLSGLPTGYDVVVCGPGVPPLR